MKLKGKVDVDIEVLGEYCDRDCLYYDYNFASWCSLFLTQLSYKKRMTVRCPQCTEAFGRGK